MQIFTPRRNYFPRATHEGNNNFCLIITVLLYQTFYNKRQNYKTRAYLNVLTRCQLDSLPFVARLCFISVVAVATLLLKCLLACACLCPFVGTTQHCCIVALGMHGRSLLCIVVPWDKRDY